VSAIIKLSQHPNIIGMKESSGNVVKMSQLVQGVHQGFNVLAGSGSYLLPAMMTGGTGGIMALSNVLPTR
jgi:4-hydroxy-2-oxoglutarate aldolase